MSWINGPPAGVVARAIFPRPPSRDSFSLVFTSPAEMDSSHQQQQHTKLDGENRGVGGDERFALRMDSAAAEKSALLIGNGDDPLLYRNANGRPQQCKE
jgi:hypothetical protein